jgi:RHH-type rel operon transcriptional repressor/antitoxin RelB
MVASLYQVIACRLKHLDRRTGWPRLADDGVVCCITNHYIETTMSVMSLRIPDEIADTLASLSKATGRSKSFLAVDALREYLAREAWQIEEIQKAVKEADDGDFATQEEVNAIAGKWTANAR